jgi:hypothetical protein
VLGAAPVATLWRVPGLERLIYVDDSYEAKHSGIAVFGWVECHPTRWRNALRGWGASVVGIGTLGSMLIVTRTREHPQHCPFRWVQER